MRGLNKQESKELGILEMMSYKKYIKDRERGISKETMMLFEKNSNRFELIYQEEKQNIITN